MDKKTTDYLLAAHIGYTSAGIPRRRRERVWPAVLQSVAIFALAIALVVLR